MSPIVGAEGENVPTVEPLTLHQTMLHEIPRGRWQEKGGSEPLFSAAPTPLNLATDRFIREEMLQPAFAFAREIVATDEYGSPVPGLVRAALADQTLLATNSKEIAEWMHRKQTNGSSAGVFMASLASSSKGDRFVILKAEHQEGVRLNHEGEGDDVVFQVEHLTELIMGQNSRVYKIGLFWIDDADQLVGLMVDKQNGVSFADYFLQQFLGCDLKHRAEVQTEDFVKALTKFINSPLISEEKRGRYATAAVAVLESPAPQLNPTSFISEFLDAEDRDVFSESLPSQIRSSTFAKDTRLVRSQIGGLKLKTSSGVTITASSEAMQNGTVTVDSDSPEGPRIIVRGSTDSYRLSRPPA
jgi:hypothetical protein